VKVVDERRGAGFLYSPGRPKGWSLYPVP